MELLTQINQLFNSQIQQWNLAVENYNAIENLQIRKIQFEGFELFLQYNPKRIISSLAKIDAKSLQERPCFLCKANRPAEQNEIIFNNHYSILVNPYPIFPKHFTIVNNIHTEQLIYGRFADMLELAKLLNEYVILYNGPKSGASAPDHFHFQAGNRNMLPIENDFRRKTNIRLIKESENVKIYLWKNYVRTTVTFQSADKDAIVRVFNRLYNSLNKEFVQEKEPMFNILVLFEQNEWIVHIFPRIQHRPQQFFEEGDKKILFSPASIDLGGVLITPREEDFLKITKEDIIDIFNQVCYDENAILNHLRIL